MSAQRNLSEPMSLNRVSEIRGQDQVVGRIGSLSHIALVVSDPGRTANLFEELLGAEIKRQVGDEGDDEVSVKMGGVWFVLPQSNVDRPITGDHIALKYQRRNYSGAKKRWRSSAMDFKWPGRRRRSTSRTTTTTYLNWSVRTHDFGTSDGARADRTRPRPSHRAERARAFSSPWNAVVRLLAEQWVTFPRFVLSGQWGKAVRQASEWRSPRNCL